MVIAADTASFVFAYSRIGLVPDGGCSYSLPRLVGMVRARELLMLGRALDGDEAAVWGVVHASAAAETLDAEVAQLVDRLAHGPTVALGLTKWLLHSGSGLDLDRHLQNEALALELLEEHQ